MTRRLAAILLLAAPLALLAQIKPGQLDADLRALDESSAKFKTAEADFKWDFYEPVVKETTTQVGSIYYRKSGSKLEMGAKINPPSAKYISYKDGKLGVFDPGTKDLKLYDTGKNKAQAESFLTLGFGGSGSDLAKAWTITDLGTEQMSDGAATVPVTKLDLVSKDQGVRNMFSHIVIWVDLNRAISLKQQFFTPAGDYRTAAYTNIRSNQNINTGPYQYKK
jgi:hypothetical protein